MKVAFISDIHGNAIALEAVLHDIGTKGVDKIYVLGDLCYRGPEPRRSLELIRALNTETIKGNADEWVVRGIREGEVPQKAIDIMNMERDWTVSRLEQSDIHFLESLSTQVTCEAYGIKIIGFHATPDGLFEVVHPHADDEILKTRMMKPSDAQIVVYGHIHRPYIRFIKGKVIMNTGSVGLPFDGTAKASYGLIEIENGNFRTSIERVGFDIERVVQLYHALNYPNADMMAEILRNASV
jgi:putative phosphoesterase